MFTVQQQIKSETKEKVMDRGVSAIISTYNRASIVGDAIKSVFSQTTPVRELLVINDGSLDNTHEVVLDLARQSPIPLRYIAKSNGGMASALNCGITEVNTEWVAFLDDDDLWSYDHIESCLKLVQNYPQLGAVMGLRHEDGSVQTPPQNLLLDYQPIADDDPDVLIRRRTPLVRPFFTTAVGTLMMRSELARKIGFCEDVGARLDIYFIWLLGEMTDIGLHLYSHGEARQFRISYLSTDTDAPQQVKDSIAIRRAKDGVKMLGKILEGRDRRQASALFNAYEKELKGWLWTLRKVGRHAEAIQVLRQHRRDLPVLTQLREAFLALLRR